MSVTRIWDGTAWVPMSVAGSGVAVYSQAGDPGAVPNGTIWIDTDDVPPAFGPPLVSTLPATPVDGQEVRYQNAAMATAGVVWHLRYRSGGGTYKWEFVGGAALLAGPVGSNGNKITTAEEALTSGPTMTVPLAGIYRVDIGCYHRLEVAGAIDTYSILGKGGAGFGLPNRHAHSAIYGAGRPSLAQLLTFAASDALTIRIGQGSTLQCAYADATISISPVRVG